jgi:hypothetical protein
MMSPEDEKMFLNQFTCGKCFHRFTAEEDCKLHIAIQHEHQPTPADLMEILEQILTTVSRK